MYTIDSNGTRHMQTKDEVISWGSVNGVKWSSVKEKPSEPLVERVNYFYCVRGRYMGTTHDPLTPHRVELIDRSGIVSFTRPVNVDNKVDYDEILEHVKKEINDIEFKYLGVDCVLALNRIT